MQIKDEYKKESSLNAFKICEYYKKKKKKFKR